jgi:hypothetical protein
VSLEREGRRKQFMEVKRKKRKEKKKERKREEDLPLVWKRTSRIQDLSWNLS